ncbi:MAG: MFS transporter [Spirochaetes bacterium]|nr:MFS transporter [Spirochaetota bacterium]
MNLLNSLYRKVQSLSKDFVLFLFAISFFGFSQGLMDSTFNNYLNETFRISSFQRGFLELPREMPGFLVVFVSAILFFFCSRRLAVFANFLAGIGIMLIGLFSFNFNIMLIWLFIYSTGQHLFLPLNSSIGMELATKNKEGRRLGQFYGAQNLFAIIGSFFIFIVFKFFNFNFRNSFLIAGSGFIFASALLLFMSPNKPMSVKSKFLLRKEYSLFYWLNILYGTRKQIFITFAPWVLVIVYYQKTYIIATLLTIGGIIGIFFKPLLGRMTDKFGERFILMSEAFILIFICLGYGFAKLLFPFKIALILTFICYIIDQLLMSVSIARATYLKKIAVSKEDISQTLTMGVTIDHIFSISIALISSLIWKYFNFYYVFLIGGIIALINFFSASRIIIKKSN